VPVFLTRQVFIKVAPEATILLSAKVTSATKAALLMQPGGLVGIGVSGVEVALACADGVSVAMDASVTITAWVAVRVGAAVSTGVCALQAEITNAKNIKITSKIFFIKTPLYL
jgi:hypothetical protein